MGFPYDEINIFYSNLAQSTPHTPHIVRRRLSTFILKTVNLTKRNRQKTSQKRPFLAKISDLNTGICGLGRHHPWPLRRPKVMPSRSSHPGDMRDWAGGFGPVKSTSRGRPEPSKWTKKNVEILALRCSLRQPRGKFAGRCWRPQRRSKAPQTQQDMQERLGMHS